MKTSVFIKRRHGLFALCFATGIWLCFLPATSWAKPNLVVDNNTHSVPCNGSYQDFTVPSFNGKIVFTLKGGDGGKARAHYEDLFGIVVHECNVNGGQGATVTANFSVGSGSWQIPPGSIIRFIVGDAGQNGNSSTSAGGTFSSGGGGGTTSSPANGTASYQAIPAPPNDLCAGAITLTCGSSNTGSAESATADDAPVSCGLGIEEGVWFKFTGTGDEMTLTTVGSNFDAQLHIYSGSCGALSCIGSDDDDAGNFQALFSFCTVLNTTYYVYLDGFAEIFGNYTINLTCNNTPPVINNCPASNFSVNAAPSLCQANVTWPVLTADDNCSIVSFTVVPMGGNPGYGGGTFPVGTTQVIYTATDQAANQSTCTFNVTVTDNQNPVIFGCPGNKSQSNQLGLCSTVVGWIAPTASDNCGVTSFTSSHAPGSVFSVGTTMVTYNAADAAGKTASCSFNVTVNDEEIPSANCPANMVKSTDAGICGAVVSYNVSYGDNCPGVSISQTGGQGSGSIFPLGTTTNTFVVTDAHSLPNSCSFTVTVNDTEKPVINNCPASNFSVNTAPGVCEANVAWTALTADDNCSIVSFTIVPMGGNPGFGGGTFPAGTTQVIFTATDQAANQRICTFNVTVTDNQNPVISGCPGNKSKSNSPGLCSASVSWTAPTASDNCSVTSFTSSHNPGNVFPKGTTTVTYTAADAAGNSATCSFTVTVNDTEKPVISGCPSSASYCWENFNFNNLSVPTATDNCGVTSQTGPAFNPNNSFNPGTTTTVTYTFSDAAGNTSTCAFTIVIFPRPLPAIATGTVPLGCQGLGVLTANVSNSNVLLLPLTYSWSNGLGNGQSVIINANGTYTVTVQDGRGCSKTASITTSINLYNTLSNYTMISTKEVELKESTVNGGVGVTDPSKKAKIKNNSAVNGFVKAADIDLNNSTINGGTSYPYPNNPPYGAATVALPVFQYNTLSNNTSPDLTVNNGQTVTISGPNKVFGKIEVKDGATLVVAASIGTLYAREIKTKNGASIVFAGNTEVRVQKKVDIDKNNNVGPNGPYTVTFWIDDDLSVKEGSSFTANVYAMKKIESKGKSNAMNMMAGFFISEYKIDSDYATWNANPNCGLPLNAPAMPLQGNTDQIGLSAMAEEERVHLEWVTNTGYKTGHFQIERSENGVDFQPLLEKENQYDGKLPKLYKDVDNTPVYGANFYRVKVYFQDGTFAYSEIRRVNFLMETGELNLFPNPASQAISFYREAYAGKQAVVSIANNQGIVVFEKTFDALPDGPVMLETGNFPDGLYRFFIKVEGMRMKSKNFVKMK